MDENSCLHCDEREDLEAEIKRLRAALKRIQEIARDDGDAIGTISIMGIVASEALMSRK